MKTLSVRPLAMKFLAMAVFLAVAPACSEKRVYEDAPPPQALQQTVSYQRDIQPIFENKCIACHSCNDAPCQLKLESPAGTQRGASKLRVYDGTRAEDLAPTRLGIDALSTGEWRTKGFFSTQYGPAGKDTPREASLLSRMIELGHQNPWPANAKLPDSIELGTERSNECPTLDEFDRYARKRPEQGMPLGVAGLTDAEYAKLQTWVDEGSRTEPSSLQPTAAEAVAIQKWERYLNREGAREKLVARYLFEHLFLAHIHFNTGKAPHFFELQRSRSREGPIVPVATVRPNDDPQGVVYYRFRLITETLVEKTHITYALTDARMRRYDKLFFGQKWDPGQAPGYSDAEKANAFLTFAAIPAKARYQFMLDEAEYFVRTFIRGPVCSGQIATDVIRDQFWAVFENPDTDRYVNDAAYRQKVTPLIGVPGQDSDLTGVASEWKKYNEQRNQYVMLRQQELTRAEPQGPSFGNIWNGDGWNRVALLTIFRHFNNAAVRRGLIGDVPDTLWMMDYPLLERSYYQLVVNFNVFGSVSHQLQTRLYFDLIRNEAEYNFLRLLPREARNPLREQWYAGGGKDKKWFSEYAPADDRVPTRIRYQPGDAKRQFVTQLYQQMRPIMGPADTLNRCASASCAAAGETPAMRTANAALRRLTAKPAAQMPVIKLMPELSYLRVTAPGGERLIYSLIHNRAHSNVAFLLGEEDRRLPEQDTLTVAPGVMGSYPNFMFDVPLAEMDRFTYSLTQVRDAKQLEAVVQIWGVRRTRPDFWEVFHDLTRYLQETDPVQAAMFDMNRYENL